MSLKFAAKAYRLLRAILMTAVDDDLIRRNPCRLPRAGLEVAAERPTLTAGQVAELAGRLPPRYSALILLTTYASLRWGEAIALQRRDLNLRAGSVRVRHSYSELSTGEIVLGPPKSRAGLRVIAFPRSLVPLLMAHLEEYAAPGEDGLVFPAAKGGPLRRSYFNRLVSWKAAVEAIGVPDLHFHDLRHTGKSPGGAGARYDGPGPDAAHGPRQRAGCDDLPARHSGCGSADRRCTAGADRRAGLRSWRWAGLMARGWHGRRSAG